MRAPRPAVLLLIATHAAFAQNSLKAPTGSLRNEFKGVVSVRELSDGRVLVAGPTGKRIAVADFKTGAVASVDHLGGAYANVMLLYALGGDSTIMPDRATRRWVMFDGARVAAILPVDAIVVQEVGPIWGVDVRGNVLTMKPSGNPGVDPTLVRDSAYAVHIRRSNGRADTVARIWLGMKPTTPGVRPRLGSADRAIMASDGWIAIVRGNPYRVDWRSPEGKWTIGNPLPPPPAVPMPHDNRAFGLPPTVETQPSIAYAWDPITTPDGKLLLRWDFVSGIYLVIDHSGKVERQLTLPVGESIVGFGTRSVYIWHRDATRTVRLDRHPWP